MCFMSQALRELRTGDGTLYEWVFGYRECSLYPASSQSHSATHSGSGHPPAVIKFQHKIFKLMSKSRPTTLDVEDGYEGNLDLALLTLAYLEKSRREDDRKKKTGFGIAAALQVQ
ncbi:hypothetical protein BJ165DRAFT_1404787 [Panaeolus papilionaceus]|nr:hypothetical protein BJ165DRAFT_1404787 [Panaeolus papilionaceus]